MIKRIFKKTPIIIITAILLSIPINTIYAYTFNVDFADTGGSSGSGSSTVKEPTPEEKWNGSKKYSFGGKYNTSGKKNGYEYKETYTCGYQYNITSTNSVTINGYNINNEKILDKSLKIKEEVLAGTSIGLEIYETKKVSYEVTYYKVKKITQVTCRDKTTNKYDCWCKENTRGVGTKEYSKELPQSGKCSSYNKYAPGWHSLKCDLRVLGSTTSCKKVNEKAKEEDVTDQKKINECKEYAVKKAKEAANSTGSNATYSIIIPNSNDKTSDQGKTTVSGKRIVNEQFSTTKNLQKLSDTRTIKYRYSTIPCMNVVTSKVRYVSDEGNCKPSDNEIIIKDDEFPKGSGIYHWHYFVPLNSKSDSTVDIKLVKNAQVTKNERSSKECLYVVMNNPVDKKDDSKTSYLDLIEPVGKTFKGDYTRTDKKSCKTCNDYKIFANGSKCILTSTIKIPIKQQFYKEKKEKSNNKENIVFTGFNFYYRSININDPFPNGTIDGIWREWAESKKKKPDIAKSYTKATYVVSNIKLNNVRNYNKENTYLNWDGMQADGTSTVITNKNLGTLNRYTKDYYKLGGGPGVKFTKKGNVITVKTGGTS